MAPRLTLCLIAKDEEELLPGCLASVEGVVDEIVLVDTGSTDRTMELARAAGARVLERPWDDDFAAPRNLAARQATGDWILMLDADERLAPGAGPALRDAVRRGGFHLGMVRLHNAHRKDAPPAEVVAGTARNGAVMVLPRVFRNADGLEWRGVIHESVGEWLLRARGRRVLLEVDLVHLGYTPDRLVARAKRDRNIALLRRRCELEREDITPFSYLALELLDHGQREEAAAVVETAWAMLELQPPWRCFHRLAAARGILALRQADAAMALETGERAEAHNGPHPDFDYLKGFAHEIRALRAAPRSGERSACLRQAAEAFEGALRRLRSDGPFEYLGSVNEVRCHLHLGVIRLLEGQPQASLRAFTAALRLEPSNPSARVGAAEALVDLGDGTRALQVVEPALGTPPDGWLIAAAAAQRVGALADAALFLGKARERSGAGYECLHRWARHEALERDLASG
jgi:tetratricopeptide (TPR) repeat protein